MEVLRSVRGGRPRPREASGPGAAGPALSWIGDERIAISGVPSARAVAGLAGQGVTHVVNCRPRAQVRWRGGPGGRAGGLRPRAGRARADAGSRPAAAARGVGGGGVLRRAGAGGSAAGRGAHPLHRRPAPLGHAGLRGAAAARARQRPGGALVLRYRPQAMLVPAYVRSVERWLAAAAR